MNLQIDGDSLRPLIESVVREVMDRIESDRAKLNGRLAFSEPEAAALLGVERHVLRDCRLRGEIEGRKIGKRIMYSRDDLVRFLEGGEA